MTGINILVADDDAAITSLIECALRDDGYDCRTVADGRQAQAALLGENFGLAILDETMPHVKGSELARWVKSQHGMATPVVIMSGGPETAVAVGEAVSSNLIAGYLPKPFTIKALVQLVKLFDPRFSTRRRAASI